MSTLFWIATASVLSFAAGFCVFALINLRRRPTVVASPAGAEGEGQDLALKDSVTSLYNRRQLLQRLDENIARCTRNNEKMAVILWDVDGFVDFNNTFGQSEGDKLLAKVAETIRKTLRVYDEAFRCGPDEFCALLVPGDENVAIEVDRRVTQIVSTELFQNDPNYAERRFSLSSGIVYFPGEYQLPEALLHAAGQALYQARKSRPS
ncbi:MAG: diguanylate cyclase [Elusimicrobia bacterium]|nr:diguanylate cyclase [Elusimicrobiota bacterium]